MLPRNFGNHFDNILYFTFSLSNTLSLVSCVFLASSTSNVNMLQFACFGWLYSLLPAMLQNAQVFNMKENANKHDIRKKITIK